MEHKVQGVIYRQQYRTCGKENCLTCQKLGGHGPYWYAIATAKPLKYIGKSLPDFVVQYEARLKELRPTMDAVCKTLAGRRDEADRTARECRDVIRQIESALAGEYFDHKLLEENGIPLFLFEKPGSL